MRQSSILPTPSPAGHYLTLRTVGAPDRAAVEGLLVDEHVCVGLGEPLLRSWGLTVAGLRPFPALAGPGIALPSTQGAVWAWTRGADPGEALDRARALVAALGPSFAIDEDIPAFLYRGGRDLTGYEDGTENPVADEAIAAAFAGETSFVAAQRWVHDLGVMARMPPHDRDLVIGRELATNAELPDAPPSAHVKRAAQEDYDPAAFMVRRSMPWGTVAQHGLYFTAFGCDLDRFERVLRRMLGQQDGIVDALFQFSRPISGGYYVCPPVRGGRLDLASLP